MGIQYSTNMVLRDIASLRDEEVGVRGRGVGDGGEGVGWFESWGVDLCGAVAAGSVVLVFIAG